MEEIIVDNSSVLELFNIHLKLKDNKRVLFTAPFGSGKSYFLNEFFENSQEYLKITLFPVDYSVASNEDIFELIKFDIFDYLIDHYFEELDLKKDDFSNLLLAQSFVSSKLNLFPFLSSLSKFFPKIEGLVDIIKDTKELINDFKRFKKDVEEGEVEQLLKFMTSIEYKKGSYKERDEFTVLIQDFLKRIKVKRENKEFVLVIDDLDRLDPDHTFRLFNIFTAHHDSKSDTNKFGFDKVIFVCDIPNIEHMFHHKFGAKSNFEGYIDKFYSYKPYFFNHKQYLKEKISDYLDSSFIENSNTKHRKINKDSNFFSDILRLTYKFIDKDILRIRNLKKLTDFSIPDCEIKVKGRSYHVSNFPLLIMTNIMCQFFPRIEDFVRIIGDLSDNYSSNYGTSREVIWNHDYFLISYSIPFFIEIRDIRKNIKITEDLIIGVDNEFGERIFLVYDVKEDWETDSLSFYFKKAVNNTGIIIGKISESEVYINPNPFHVFKKALEICIDNGYIYNDNKY
ncbi:hypothetical protein FYC62_14945 [Pedobacter aquae]|uniref:KAP NTPase domain-containing protein n=1 Tax=Pedobacter aquae TaxID=2605747 RepID=A0A5C0VJD0_9SPHI|nr:P-loop NTPase fold protein [Pedobacter aquae]QEK52815.1 hypothetical protein FYC62_14945 [Pedobacter aquae]